MSLEYYAVARRLRIQYGGAIYHVINRGNYRSDVFDSIGAAHAFEEVLAEACTVFGWRMRAYVIMRNHYHLALETPEPNLVEGMHWLQSTYATRFNRFRSERGHLFQGRYQSLLVEDDAALVRVVDYIHLNPVRANLIPALQVHQFRWSSLRRFCQPDRPPWLIAGSWLEYLGCTDTSAGWIEYVEALIERVATIDNEREHKALCHGWAIGTAAWREAIAREYQHLSVHRGIPASELRDLKHARWQAGFEAVLKANHITPDAIASAPKSAAWKCELAEQLRTQVHAPHAWIAEKLHLGHPDSLRSRLSHRRTHPPQNSA